MHLTGLRYPVIKIIKRKNSTHILTGLPYGNPVMIVASLILPADWLRLSPVKIMAALQRNRAALLLSSLPIFRFIRN